MLSGKEVTEKADGIVPKAPALAAAVRLCPPDYQQTILWSFRFSQLRGSSDDGKARLKLLFQHLHIRQVETKELEFPDLTAVLHCVYAFLAAKVASLDPGFAGSQGLSRKPLGSS